MVKGAFNWTYSDVIALLKDNGFRLNHAKGSHHFFVGMVGGKMRQVCVPKHGNQAFKPRTLKGMILQSGLPKHAWGM